MGVGVGVGGCGGWEGEGEDEDKCTAIKPLTLKRMDVVGICLLCHWLISLD
jgi:hypothetical protein